MRYVTINYPIYAANDVAPKHTVKCYKLFRIKGGRLFPLYVEANTPVPLHKWLKAKIGPKTPDGKVKSKLGKLAMRPGWHCSEYPVALHIGGKLNGNNSPKPDYRPDNQVWAEVEIGADIDWQKEANRRASTTKAGKILPRTAHITDQIPEGGYYRYKTNPNMYGDWLIAGEMRVNKILSDDQVKKINDKTGIHDLPRLNEIQDSSVT